MSEPTNAELAQSLKSLSEGFRAGTSARRNLSLAAQRLEANPPTSAQEEITEAKVEAAYCRLYDGELADDNEREWHLRLVRKALEAASKA